LIPIETSLSGVLLIPAGTFIMTMSGVYLVVGIIEGLVTAGVVVYLGKMRPELVLERFGDKRSIKGVLLSLCVISIIISGGVLTHFSSDKPDGLEWSYKYRGGEAGFESVISNDSETVVRADVLQAKFTPLPNYNLRETNRAGIVSGGWKSFAAVVGSLGTMFVIWLLGWSLRKKAGVLNAPCSN